MKYIDACELNDFDASGFESYELAFTSDYYLGLKMRRALQAVEAEYMGKFLAVVARDFEAKKCGYLLVHAADWDVFERYQRPVQSPAPGRQEQYRLRMERLYAGRTLMPAA